MKNYYLKNQEERINDQNIETMFEIHFHIDFNWYQFILKWESHKIIEQNSYLTSWKQITKFIIEILKQFSKRFSATEFLQILDIINPTSWKASKDERYQSDIWFIIIMYYDSNMIV